MNFGWTNAFLEGTAMGRVRLTLALAAGLSVVSGSLVALAGTASASSATQIAQASTSGSPSEDDAYRSMTRDAVNAVQNFGKAEDPATEAQLLRSRAAEAIRNLEAVSEADGLGKSAQSQAAAQELRAAIREIVRHADENGQSNDYVVKLIEEAFESSRLDVAAAVLGADRDLDAAAMIRSIVERSLAPAEKDADAMYLAALKGEAVTGVTPATFVATPAKVAAAPSARPESIVVATGDTLGGIARKYYGDVAAYKKIFAANQDRLKDPNLIFVGIKLRLP